MTDARSLPLSADHLPSTEAGRLLLGLDIPPSKYWTNLWTNLGSNEMLRRILDIEDESAARASTPDPGLMDELGGYFRDHRVSKDAPDRAVWEAWRALLAAPPETAARISFVDMDERPLSERMAPETAALRHTPATPDNWSVASDSWSDGIDPDAGS